MREIRNNYPLSVVYILVIIAMLFWSFAYIWVKQLYEMGFDLPITITFFRLIVASIVLTVVTYLLKIKDNVLKTDYKYMFLLAFAEPFCYFLGEMYGMLYVSATIAAVMIATIPLVIPVFAWLFIREKVNIYEIVGLIVSFFGVLILVLEDLNLGGKIIGFLLMGIAILSGTGYSILVKKMADKYNALTITKYQSIIGMCLFLPLFATVEFKAFSDSPFTFDTLRFILLLGVLPSSISFTFLAIGIRRLGVVRASIFSNLIPVFVGIMSFFILKETFTLTKILAMSVVVFGLFVSQLNRIRRPLCLDYLF
jgi:drug/metabolite transporter (DMT)-like permease